MKALQTKLVRLSTTRQFKLHPKTNTITVEVKPLYASKTKHQTMMQNDTVASQSQ